MLTKTLPSLVSNYDEILSWMIEIRMKNNLVSDNCRNTLKNIIPWKFYNEWQIMLGQHLVLVTLHRGLRLVLSKTIRIGDIEYHI